MAEDFIAFQRPCIDKEEEDAVLEVLRSGWLTTSKVTLEFEKEFAAFLNEHTLGGDVSCIAVNSNTSGMILAMEAAGIGKGDRVITSPYTFNSTPASVVHMGGIVDFVDIAPNSYNIDCDAIERLLESGEDFKAIVPVHIGGVVCDMNRIQDMVTSAEKRLGHKIYIIEDCAHSFPSLTAKGYAGTLGDMGVYSFYATKTITTAEGGMVAVRDSEALKLMSTLRLHGMSRSLWDRYTAKKASWEYDIVQLGYKFNLPDILSAIGRVQLKKATTFLERRSSIAARYNEGLYGNECFELPPSGEGNAWHLYMIRLNLDTLKVDRNEFIQRLQDRGIGVSVHFIPSFRLTYWRELYPSLKAADYPNADRTFLRTISLPMWAYMTPAMVDRVIESVLAVVKECKR